MSFIVKTNTTDKRLFMILDFVVSHTEIETLGSSLCSSSAVAGHMAVTLAGVALHVACTTTTRAALLWTVTCKMIRLSTRVALVSSVR